MADPNYITTRGLERMIREVEWLEKVERPKIVAEVAYAAAMGDRSENAEYIYGKKRLRSIDSRRHFLMKRLEAVRVVEPASLSGQIVRFGATVVIEDDQGERRTWRIYGEDEVDIDKGILSWRSPLGRALIGKPVGESVTYHAPAGAREVEIVSVSFDVQAPLPEDLVFMR